MGSPVGTSSNRAHWWLAPVAIALVALSLRILAVGLDGGYVPRNDAWDYDRHAASIAAGDGYPSSSYGSGIGPTALRPPGYPVALAGVYALTGDSVTAGRIAGAVLGAITVLLIFLIAAPLWGRTVGLAAAAIAAVYPPLVLLPQELFSENLFIPLMLASLLCALRYRSSARLGWAAGAGVACGLALLTRNVGLALIVPLVLMVALGVRRPGSPLAAPALLLGCAVLALVPWTVRNESEFGRLIPIAASSGVTLSGTYNQASYADDAHPGGWRNPASVPEFAPIFDAAGIDEATLDSELRSRALSFATGHPGYVAEVSWHNLLRLFLLEGGSVVTDEGEVHVSGIGNTSSAAEQVAVAIAAVLALAGLVASLMAGARRRGRSVPWFIWLLAGLLLLASLPLGGLPRYRLALDPFIVMFAALGAVAIAESLPALVARARRRGGAVATTTLAVALLGVLGGCGGGDQPASSTSATGQSAADPAERDRYVERADAICARTIAATRRLRQRIESEPLPSADSPAAVLTRALVEPGLRIRAREAARLRALPRPAGESEALDTYLGLFDVTDELLRRRLKLGLEGSVAEAHDLELLIIEVADEQRAAAREYGFDECGRDLLRVLLPPNIPG